MHFRARKALVVLAVGLTIGAPSASGETIWQWTHQAEGEGWAHVFDGGPVEFDSGSTTGPGDTGMGFLAFDLTRPGVMGARYGTSGTSQLFPHEEDLLIDLRFSTDYSATSRLGSDRPGGEGSGRIRSVVEVVMPADDMEAEVNLDIGQTAGFGGSTRLVIENVTESTELLAVGESGRTFLDLEGMRGDVLRLTFESEGQGSAPAGIPAIAFYSVRGSAVFIIPEPTALALLGTGIGVVFRRRAERSRAQ